MGNQISHCYLIRYPDVTVSDTRILPYTTLVYYRIRHPYITRPDIITNYVRKP